MNAATLPALGIDLGGTKIEARLLAMDGTELWRRRVRTPSGDYSSTLLATTALVQDARVAAGNQAFTVGVGTPGTESASGLMKNCNSSCLNGRPLRQDLQAALGQPIRMANDANCLALSEATDGAGAGAGVVFAAILGTGTGAGIAVNGRVLQGPNGLAGEWGHNPVPFGVHTGRRSDDPNFECYCGLRGCIETMLSGPGLARDHAWMHQQLLTGEQIAARASAGDPECMATMERHAHRLARSLAAVINLLDPDIIVLGGGLSLLPHLYQRVPALWGQWVFSGGLKEPVRTRLEPAKHGDASGARGAAWLWWHG